MKKILIIGKIPDDYKFLKEIENIKVTEYCTCFKKYSSAEDYKKDVEKFSLFLKDNYFDSCVFIDYNIFDYNFNPHSSISLFYLVNTINKKIYMPLNYDDNNAFLGNLDYTFVDSSTYLSTEEPQEVGKIKIIKNKRNSTPFYKFENKFILQPIVTKAFIKYEINEDDFFINLYKENSYYTLNKKINNGKEEFISYIDYKNKELIKEIFKNAI